MHTDTAMDYIDQQSRLFRGGPCYTTVPAINVVAEKHYAWALPIAAGIATNREGVPWGYLGSVNDVFKSPQSDRDQSMAFAHPQVSGGAFTYTSIHEASHYLGLAHPHDSIGATRNADGTPRYYDGFTWAFNSTAAPTTYSHTELVYSILDQENIARGHAAYYLKWADQALSARWRGVRLARCDPGLAAAGERRAAAQGGDRRAEEGRGGVRPLRLRQRDVRGAEGVPLGGRVPRHRPGAPGRHDGAREGHQEAGRFGLSVGQALAVRPEGGGRRPPPSRDRRRDGCE